MRKRKYYSLILFFVFLAFSCFITVTGQGIRIAVVADHCNPAELTSMKKALAISQKFQFETISLQNLNNSSALKRFTHVWYHRTDTLPFSLLEKSVGAVLKPYVRQGGHLVLSMEAVPLLNEWGIEQTTFAMQQDTVKDAGFGRPLGFHGFKEHPLFHGLMGGVYTCKQKKDHVVRKHGFFNDSIPAQGKVIGIQWTYITFTEENKLLLEYNWGKGKIIAAGSYLYYDSDNYQQKHLEKFTENLFLYTAGKINSVKTFHWKYKKNQITPASFSTTRVKIIPASRWKLPQPTLSLQQEKGTSDFYDLVGRKILWMGKMNGGVDEIWMHPFMALRDFHVGLRLKGRDSITWMRHLSPMVTLAPEYLVRTYRLGSSTLKEIHTVSFDDPAGVAHFETEGSDITEIVVEYSSNLRFMWPYSHAATGNILYAFDKAINAHIISGQDGALTTVVAYSIKPMQQNIAVKKELNGVTISNRFAVKGNMQLNVYITGSAHHFKEAIQLFANRQQQMSQLFRKSNDYYRSLIKHHLTIETPDTLFNQGYCWALARTDQFLQTTPGIGTALMAGFGTTARGWNGRHTISGRPGYAWYFGRDGEWSAMAINAYGGFTMVREMLETLIRYQDINGKIYHELTSSGVAHYDASDATPLFVVLAAHYLKYSGDLAYIRSRWSAIKKAMDFCFTTDTDGDGLIENTNVGHGWIEGGSLFGTHTEFYLAGCWAAALDAAQYMATHLQKPSLALNYARNAQQAKNSIDKEFWNGQQRYFYNGKMLDGSFMQEATVLATVPVYLKVVTDLKKVQHVNERLGSNYFSTDWGIRMIEDSSKKYRPGSYHAGMVWPLYGGWAALSEFSTGHNKSGFQHLMSNLLGYRHWGLGSLEETLNGDHYKPNGVCSHQCWSETMVLQPAIEGMLGLEPDALANTIKLSPYFPWHWKKAKVQNIRAGSSLVHMEMKREKNETRYTFLANRPVKIVFHPKFPFGTAVQIVRLNGKPLQVTNVSNAEGITLESNFTLPQGRHTLVVRHTGGIAALPVVAYPKPGDSSTVARIVAEEWKDGRLTLLVEGRPETTHSVKLFTASRSVKVEGAVEEDRKDDLLTVKVKLPAAKNEKYVKKAVHVTIE